MKNDKYQDRPIYYSYVIVNKDSKVKWFIDPETGEILREKGPWWGFLARDVEED